MYKQISKHLYILTKKRKKKDNEEKINLSESKCYYNMHTRPTTRKITIDTSLASVGVTQTHTSIIFIL